MNFCLASLVLVASNVAASRWGSPSRLHSRLESSSAVGELAQDCKCAVSGTCSCAEAMEFMSCIDAACQSGQCQCKRDNGGHHYADACGVMKTYCPAIGMQCDASPPTCGAAAAQNISTKTAVVPFNVHESKVAEKKAHGHHLFAFLFLFLFFTVALSFAMANSKNDVVAKNTWTVIDSIAVVSMAITVFYVCTQLFDDITGGLAHWKVLMHVAYAVLILLVATFGSYTLRDDKVGQTSFNAVLYWMCLLAKSGALTTAQSSLSSSMAHVCLITLGSLLFFAVLILITHQIKPQPGWYDTVETNLAGGALAAGVCLLVGMLINGLDHSPDKTMDRHKTMMTNAFALFTCVTALLFTPRLSRMQTANKNYWLGRVLAFVDGFVGILPYFTVSLGSGAMVCHLLDLHPNTVMAKLVSAATAVVYGGIMIMACAYIPYLKQKSTDIKALSGLILGFGGYIAGYALADLLCGTINEVVDGRDLASHEKTHAKMAIIGAFNLVLIPVYLLYLKPLVMKKTA